MNELENKLAEEKEAMRKELQDEIDRLLQQIEAEKQNMGAAGKKREEELLAKIEALRKDIGYRDTSIA